MTKKKKVVFKFDDRSIETLQEGGPYLGMIYGKPYPDALRLAAFDELKDLRVRTKQLEARADVLRAFVSAFSSASSARPTLASARKLADKILKEENS